MDLILRCGASERYFAVLSHGKEIPAVNQAHNAGLLVPATGRASRGQNFPYAKAKPFPNWMNQEKNLVTNH